IIEEQYVNLETMLTQKQLRLGELHQQMMVGQMFPRFEMGGESDARKARIPTLKMEVRKGMRVLSTIRRITPKFDSDPAAIEWSKKLDEVMDELEELRSIRTETPVISTETILEEYRREIEADRELQQTLLARMQDSHPVHQRILGMMDERREK